MTSSPVEPQRLSSLSLLITFEALVNVLFWFLSDLFSGLVVDPDRVASLLWFREGAPSRENKRVRSKYGEGGWGDLVDRLVPFLLVRVDELQEEWPPSTDTGATCRMWFTDQQ